MIGGKCIFILDNIEYDRVNLDKYCADFDTELCAVRIQMFMFYLYTEPLPIMTYSTSYSLFD
jgi:hypothetical protein